MISLKGAHVVITGGTGSFGHAMIKHLLLRREGPERVAVISRDEVKQAEMRALFADDIRLRFFLGDVRDHERLRSAFKGADVVFHAAALKRVEACAYSPQEAVKTNIVGSMNVASAAVECGVRKVVAISSDKACASVNAYGASKAMMEHVFTSSTAYAEAARYGGTVFSCIRYGNVAASRGSVIPLWRDAHARGYPLPVVDAEHTRFWFTLEEAVRLALWALEHCTGGELVVPVLRAFRVGDLADAIAGTDYPWRRVAERPGEKAHESLVSQDEVRLFRSWGGHVVRFLAGNERGEPLPVGYTLNSRNAERMTRGDLRAALDDLGLISEKEAHVARTA